MAVMTAHAAACHGLVPWLAAGLLAAACLALGVLLLRCRAAGRASSGRAAGLEAEVERLKSEAATQEYRVERFDVLWFPTVAADPARKAVLDVKPGQPHCPACVVPLKAGDAASDWTCPACNASRPATVVDLMVIDDVSKTALAWFLQKHPGWSRPRPGKTP